MCTMERNHPVVLGLLYLWSLLVSEGLRRNCEFAIGMCQFVIASAASFWYFSHGNEKLKNESHICKSFWRGLFFHGGSVAFGALILLMMWLLQLIF